MRVFTTWSGEQDKSIAEAFREWLPSVIQNFVDGRHRAYLRRRTTN
jgi:hypothetical protein